MERARGRESPCDGVREDTSHTRPELGKGWGLKPLGIAWCQRIEQIKSVREVNREGALC